MYLFLLQRNGAEELRYMECRMGHIDLAPAAMMRLGGIISALHKVAADLSGQIAKELSHESFRDLIADLPMMRFTVSFDFELGSVIGQINNVGNAMTQTDQQGSQRIDLKA